VVREESIALRQRGAWGGAGAWRGRRRRLTGGCMGGWGGCGVVQVGYAAAYSLEVEDYHIA
jgi:hypothetical protein